jgi:hypothetical protein
MVQTITTMEEVFLAATQLSVDEGISAVKPYAAAPTTYEDMDDESDDTPLIPFHNKTAGPSGSELNPTIMAQLAALIWKRKLKIYSEPIFTSAQIM